MDYQFMAKLYYLGFGYLRIMELFSCDKNQIYRAKLKNQRNRLKYFISSVLHISQDVIEARFPILGVNNDVQSNEGNLINIREWNTW